MTDPDLARAEHLLELGRATEAEQIARTALGRDPDSEDAIEVLARSLRRQERYEEAATIARHGLGQHPDSSDLLLVLVDCLVGLAGGETVGEGRVRRGSTPIVTEARALSDRLVQQEPHWWVSHYARARALLAGDRPRVRDALEAGQQAVWVAPHSADAHNMVGICLDLLKQTDAARAAYTEALRLNPQHSQAMNNLATLDVGFFRLREAARGFRNAASISPGEGMAQQNLRMLTVRLAMRILLVVLIGAGCLAIALATEAPWWARAALGAALVAGTAWFVSDSRTHLPRGMAVSPRALVDALGWGERIWIGITAVALVCLVVMSFAPHDLAVGAGVGLLMIGRVLLIGVIIGGLAGAVRGLFRR